MIDEQTWRRCGSREAAPFSHALADHPLFRLDSLAELADRLEPDQIETTDAHSPIVVGKRVTRRLDGPGAGELVADTEAGGRWFAFRHVESDPSYRDLVEDVFDRFKRESGAGAARTPEGYVFIGASGATTPAHVDHEHNLFFQICGTKRFTTGGFPTIDLEQETFEAMYSDQYGSTDFEPVDPITHVLTPGDGLYVPPPAVHYVENDNSLAISFSLVFHDDALDRQAKVYAFNSHLRQLGRRPRPPGQSAVGDRVKAGIVDGWRTARSRTARSS